MAEDGPRTPDEVLAANLRMVRRRRFWDQRYTLDGGDELSEVAAEDLEQEHVAARMRDLGHRWVRQTVSEVERGNRRVTAAELLSLALVLGASIGHLLEPHGSRLALDPGGRVQVDSTDLAALVCGHTRRATVEWGGEDLAELVGVQFREADK
jgi:transcriptional regulator with XRE-family HTH domain